MSIAFSVDLEPNKDGSFDGVKEAMDWFDNVIPTGTVFATHRIASELPEVIESLADDHEIGVHVHPHEFGHEHDQLAELEPDRQRELIDRTRTELGAIVDEPITSFRAGRHSASFETLEVLSELGFTVDASAHVRYQKYFPEQVTRRSSPFEFDNGLFEVPTTYVRPPLLSRPGIRVFPQRSVTATSTTLRTDSRGCTGERAMRYLFGESDVVSMYMHPYDATDYQSEIDGTGALFRERVERVLPDEPSVYVTVSELNKRNH